MSSYLAALALTVLIEVPAYLLGLAALRRLGTAPGGRAVIGIPEAIALAVAVNVATHPALWLIFGSGAGWTSALPALLVAECVVAVVEGLLIFAVLHRDAGWLLLLAAAANAASLAAGLM